MEKPPTVGEAERKKKKEFQKHLEKIKDQERQKLDDFRVKVQQKIKDFVKDDKLEKIKFDPMDKVYRAIVHEIAEVAGLTSFSFGQEDVDRHIILWKKEFAPSDEEIAAHRKGEEWDPEKAKRLVKEKLSDTTTRSEAAKLPVETAAVNNYQEKYNNIMARRAQETANLPTTTRTYGFVSIENKMDKRTIEQVMADNKARKKMKMEQSDSG